MGREKQAYRVSRIAGRAICSVLLVGSVCLLLAGCSDQPGVEEKAPAFEAQGEALTVTNTVSVKLPIAVSIDQLVVAAETTLNAADRVKLGGTATAATSGSGGIFVGNDATVATLVSAGTASVGDRTSVSGDITAGGPATISSSAMVPGTVSQNATVGVASVSWAFEVDDTPLGNVQVNAGSAVDLTPGTYGNLNLNSQGSVTLHAGVYVFSNLSVQAQSKLLVDSANGPVQVYVSGAFNYQGSVEAATGGIPQLLFGLSSTTPATVSAPFTGVLLAPNATVNVQAALPIGHRALFYGKNVQLQPDTIIKPLPFDWSAISPELAPAIAANALPHEMPRSPADINININGYGSGSGGTTPGGTSKSSDSATPVTFTLPETYPVKGGLIANGTVSFGFSNAGGQLVTCTYVGGSTTATPSTPNELNAGRYLNFDSCSDQLPASEPRTADHFELSATPAAGYPVSVGTPVIKDGYCSEEMELLSAQQTAQMRAGFSWDTAAHVAANNADGTPTLYYAWVYLSNTNDAINLRRLRIHALNRPLFQEELDAFAGRCGALTNPGDGDGIFVPAVLPGALYNRLVDALNAPNLSGNREVFEAVILRPVPAVAANPNGSVRYDALAQSGFTYLGYEPRPLADPNTITQYSSVDPIAALVDVIDYVGQGIGAIIDGVQQGLALFGRFVSGTSTVTFNLHGLTGDTAFADPVMVRGWGPLSTRPLGALGMRTTLIQDVTAFGIPVDSVGHTNINGRVTIDAISVAAPASLCVELKNDAALVTDFIWSVDVCDFRALTPGGGTAPLALQLDRVDRLDGQEVTATIDETRLVGFYQANDAFRWARDVAGFRSRRGTLMSGYYANTFSLSDDGVARLYAPCLGYTDIGSEFAAGTLAAGGLLSGLTGGVNPILIAAATVAATLEEVLGRTDVMMATTSKIPRNREVMTHEYGHFLFCGMMHQANPASVENLVWTVMLEGEDNREGYNYLNEAVADFITGQVVGAADYDWLRGPNGFVRSATGDNYCNNSGPCFDQNLNASALNQLNDARSIGRIATMLFDAFDGAPMTKMLAVPNNADSWESTAPGVTPAGLVFSPVSYGSQDAAVESVALTGPRLVDFAGAIGSQLHGFNSGTEIDDELIYGALNTAMLNDGVASWCARCSVLGLHSTMRGLDTDIGGLFNTCTVDPVVAGALGPPPEPAGNIDAATCTACPAGQVVDATGACIPCDGTVVGNACLNCGIDAVVDGNTLEVELLDTSVVTPGDACPTVFWVQLDNPRGVFDRGGNRLDIATVPITTTGLDEAGTDLAARGQFFNQADCERTYELSLGHLGAVGPVVDTTLTQTATFAPCSGLACQAFTCAPVPAGRFTLPQVIANTPLFFAAPADPARPMLLLTDLSPPPPDPR